MEAIDEHCFMAGSSWLAQPTFFTTQDHLFEVGSPTVGWVISWQLAIEKMCQACRQGI